MWAFVWKAGLVPPPFPPRKKCPGLPHTSQSIPVAHSGINFRKSSGLQLLISFERGVDNTTTRNRKKKNTETQLLNHFLFKMLMYQLPILHTGELFSSTFFFLNRKIDTDRGKQVGTKQVQEPSNKHHKRNPCAAWDRWDWYIYRTFSGLLYIFMVNS